MIFPSLKHEAIVQVDDLTRLDASKTTASPDEADVSLIEIQPEAGADYYNVTSDKFLDWEYKTAGAKTVTVRVTTDGAPVEITRTLTVVTEDEDRLFSSDSDLSAIEPDILQWVRSGRNSFKDVHRQAQMLILDVLDEMGIKAADGSRISPEAIAEKEQVRKWATYLALQLIFEGLSNATDDVFSKKADKYESMAVKAQSRINLKVDSDADGKADATVSMGSVKVTRK